MKNKKVAALFFIFLIFFVGYFVYHLIQSDYSPELELIENQTEKIENLKTNGFQDFQAPTVSNSVFKFSNLSHRVVILNFWASWCGPCVEEFPSLLKLVENANGQVALVAISLDNDEKQMSDFLKNYDISNPNIYVLKDPNYTLAESFGTLKLPESYILREKKLVRKISGAIDWTSEDIVSLVNSL